MGNRDGWTLCGIRAMFVGGLECTCARRPGGCCWKDTLAPWFSLAWAVGEWAWWFTGCVSDTGSSAKPCNGHDWKGRGKVKGVCGMRIWGAFLVNTTQD